MSKSRHLPVPINASRALVTGLAANRSFETGLPAETVDVLNR
ncbi:hypothetical protein [Kribbella sp. NPDC004875]